MSRIILDLCGGTGSWSAPYREAGYDVRLVTLPEQDVRTYVPPEGVWGILAAPPCTEFAVSGARWWAEKGDKAPELFVRAVEVLDACRLLIFRCQPRWWALENPPGRFLRSRLGEPRLSFQPTDYGDPYTKRTLVWGNFRPPFKGALVEATQGSKMHKIPPGPQRQELRSITPPGFALAFFEANP